MMVVFKCVIVYLARDIPAFIMYCVNGASRSSLLIESTDSMIRVMRIPHISTKRKLLTEAGSPNILVHVVATYDAFQTVLGFLCCYVLRHLPDIHARDVFAAYNRMVEDIRRTSLLGAHSLLST